MKKSKRNRKLELNIDTVRTLAKKDLGDAVGGCTVDSTTGTEVIFTLKCVG
jgi:hypothetical protein